jgi:hypothetical protein
MKWYLFEELRNLSNTNKTMYKNKHTDNHHTDKDEKTSSIPTPTPPLKKWMFAFDDANEELYKEYQTIIRLYKNKRKQEQMLTKETVDTLDAYIHTHLITNSRAKAMYRIDVNSPHIEFHERLTKQLDSSHFNRILFNPIGIQIPDQFSYFKHMFSYPYICIDQHTTQEFQFGNEMLKEDFYTRGILIDTPDELKKDKQQHYCSKLFRYYQQSKYKDYLVYHESWKGLSFNEKIKKLINPDVPLYKNCSLYIHKYSKYERYVRDSILEYIK